jgi:hypothetical protein
MVQLIVAPVKSDATPLDSALTFQGTPEYTAITKASGVSEFTTGTQAERTAKALAIVKKYYPEASETNPLVKISFAHADTSTRNKLGALIVAETKKAGFAVTEKAYSDLFGERGNINAIHDVTMYGFGLNSLSQSNGTEIYKSDGGNNVWGWNSSSLDELAKSLQGDILTAKEATAKRLAMDKIIIGNYWGLPLYANPTITAFNKDLKNVKPAPVGNNITWNFFEWSY